MENNSLGQEILDLFYDQKPHKNKALESYHDAIQWMDAQIPLYNNLSEFYASQDYLGLAEDIKTLFKQEKSAFNWHLKYTKENQWIVEDADRKAYLALNGHATYLKDQAKVDSSPLELINTLNTHKLMAELADLDVLVEHVLNTPLALVQKTESDKALALDSLKSILANLMTDEVHNKLDELLVVSPESNLNPNKPHGEEEVFYQHIDETAERTTYGILGEYVGSGRSEKLTRYIKSPIKIYQTDGKLFFMTDSGQRILGLSRDGELLLEDEKGVRSSSMGGTTGIMKNETVSIVPTPSGLKTLPPRELEKDFQVRESIASKDDITILRFVSKKMEKVTEILSELAWDTPNTFSKESKEYLESAKLNEGKFIERSILEEKVPTEIIEHNPSNSNLFKLEAYERFLLSANNEPVALKQPVAQEPSPAQLNEGEKDALEFRYQMLGRLKMDLEYYFGNGNRHTKHLHYLDLNEHLKETEKLINSFSKAEKPEYFTLKDLEKYKKLAAADLELKKSIDTEKNPSVENENKSDKAEADLERTADLFSGMSEVPKNTEQEQYKVRQVEKRKISDTGYIPGAAKERWGIHASVFETDLTKQDIINTTKIATIFPEIDPEKMLEDGVAKKDVNALVALRSQMPRRPSVNRKLDSWADDVAKIRVLSQMVIGDKESNKEFWRIMDSAHIDISDEEIKRLVDELIPSEDHGFDHDDIHSFLFNEIKDAAPFAGDINQIKRIFDNYESWQDDLQMSTYGITSRGFTKFSFSLRKHFLKSSIMSKHELENINLQIKLIESVPTHLKNSTARNLTVKKYIRSYKDKTNDYGLVKGKYFFGEIRKNLSDLIEYNYDQIIALAESKLVRKNDRTNTKQKDAISLDLYRAREGYFLGLKANKEVLVARRAPEHIQDRKEASKWKSEIEEEVKKELEELKGVKVRGQENRQRTGGKDWRKGSNITEDELKSTFQLREVQFGNSLLNSQEEAQLKINQTYDALKDLAYILGIPDETIGLSGSLGLALGARGKGGRNAASAHYEPIQVVMNLTRRNGAGALGHEWFHALDNYYLKIGTNGLESVINGKSKLGYASEQSEEIRHSIEKISRSFTAIAKGFTGEFLDASKMMDGLGKKKYWSSGREMAARSFESYLKLKLHEKGITNDYLVNINASMDMEDTNLYSVYPNAHALKHFGLYDAFESLVENIEAKKLDGRYVLSKRNNSIIEGDANPQIVKQWIAGVIQDTGVDIKVVESIHDLPASLKDTAMANNSAGLYDILTDTPYLIANRIETQEHAIKTALHEGIGHSGVLNYLLRNAESGGGQVVSVLDKMFNDLGENAIKERLEHYNFDFSNEGDRREAALEYIAYLAEDSEYQNDAINGTQDLLSKKYEEVYWTESDVKNLIEVGRLYTLKQSLNKTKEKHPSLHQQIDKIDGKIKSIISSNDHKLNRLLGGNSELISTTGIKGFLSPNGPEVKTKPLEHQRDMNAYAEIKSNKIDLLLSLTGNESPLENKSSADIAQEAKRELKERLGHQPPAPVQELLETVVIGNASIKNMIESFYQNNIEFAEYYDTHAESLVSSLVSISEKYKQHQNLESTNEDNRSLAMDKESRLARAESLGFDTNKVMYYAEVEGDHTGLFGHESLNGLHLSTAKSASGLVSEFEGAVITPVYTSAINPIKLPDLCSWELEEVVECLAEKGIEINNQAGVTTADIYEALLNKGYDSIVYENQYEDKGSESIIVIDKIKVRSIHDGFNEGVPNLKHSLSKIETGSLIQLEQSLKANSQKPIRLYPALNGGAIDVYENAQPIIRVPHFDNPNNMLMDVIAYDLNKNNINADFGRDISTAYMKAYAALGLQDEVMDYNGGDLVNSKAKMHAILRMKNEGVISEYQSKVMLVDEYINSISPKSMSKELSIEALESVKGLVEANQRAMFNSCLTIGETLGITKESNIRDVNPKSVSRYFSVEPVKNNMQFNSLAKSISDLSGLSLEESFSMAYKAQPSNRPLSKSIEIVEDTGRELTSSKIIREFHELYDTCVENKELLGHCVNSIMDAEASSWGKPEVALRIHDAETLLEAHLKYDKPSLTHTNELDESLELESAEEGPAPH